MRRFVALIGAVVFMACVTSCGGEQIYNACGDPEDCEVPDGADAECLDKSGEGFCTWSCDDDSDCADADEDYDFVCSSFESEAGQHCFPSCEDNDDEDACPAGYGCRSTGGGAENRKVCFPE